MDVSDRVAMREWIDEFLYVVMLSKRTQWASILGVVLFVGVSWLGEYVASNFELSGTMSGFEDALAHKAQKKYDKAALVVLVSFWILAFKFYQKDKKRFL